MEYVKTIIISIVISECVFKPAVAQRFEPRLEVTGCTKSRLNVTIRDAADGGIVYIEGPSTTCSQFTQPRVSEHVFDVRACAINWSETFRVIVQRHPLYQTGADKRFPVTCIPDTSDINVGSRLVNINVLDKEDEEGITKTIRPTATMYLYRDGVDVNGKTVKLTDELTMIIQLDNDHANDFDIQAIECYADNIQTIADRCPVDENLFPKFTSVVQGKLQAKFGVFRPTQLDDGTVNIEFTCTLQVFLGQHIPTACGGNVGLHAVRKRKLQAANKKIDKIFVGNSVLVNTEDIATEKMFTMSAKACTKETLYVGIIALFAVSFLVTLILCLCTRRKLRAERKLRALQRNEINNDFED
ncbi:uncharacterized protein LOC123550200 [Mercenaria mercenaria]|uniref:uncharacterized protein LOC123550200 n=1 Tax=Mercenaria mercenaria TaxID=6596 RepID=UPI00234E6DF4|nr:uncharacterized protein LOC123550200 [Mercenaria mercenaria]